VRVCMGTDVAQPGQPNAVRPDCKLVAVLVHAGACAASALSGSLASCLEVACAWCWITLLGSCLTRPEYRVCCWSGRAVYRGVARHIDAPLKYKYARFPCQSVVTLLASRSIKH
jgi:hypothetical protein